MMQGMEREELTSDEVLRYLDLVLEELGIIVRGFNAEGDRERYERAKAELALLRGKVDAEHDRRVGRRL